MNAVRAMRQGLGHGAVMLAVALAATTGCKSGSWAAKPSWWTAGGTDPDKLAAAPTFSDDVTKPSATAKPYPTTTTPEGYVLANGGQAPAVAAAPATTPVPTPAPITYGSAPPAAAATSLATVPPANSTSTASPGLSSATTPLSSIAPQVGPYAATAPSTPPESSLPASSLATVPPPVQPATQSAFDPAARVADARGSSAWQPTASSPADASGSSRYGAVNGSRFSGGSVEPPASSAGFVPASIDSPPAAVQPAAAPSSFPPPPAAFSPPAAGAAPVGVAPAAVPATTPSTTLPPSGRRTDPGYRPGGTSSYRSSRDMLGGEGSIQPVSFESTP